MSDVQRSAAISGREKELVKFQDMYAFGSPQAAKRTNKQCR
jgi:hypothetical protein